MCVMQCLGVWGCPLFLSPQPDPLLRVYALHRARGPPKGPHRVLQWSSEVIVVLFHLTNHPKKNAAVYTHPKIHLHLAWGSSIGDHRVLLSNMPLEDPWRTPEGPHHVCAMQCLGVWGGLVFFCHSTRPFDVSICLAPYRRSSKGSSQGPPMVF